MRMKNNTLLILKVVLLFIWMVLSRVEGKRIEEWICQSNSRTLRCNDNLVIEVVNATYGRDTNTTRCGQKPALSKPCFIPALEVLDLSAQCYQKESCALTARRGRFNESFDDSCLRNDSVNHWLTVIYDCVMKKGPQTTLLDQISTFPQTTAATSQSSFPRKTLISIVIVAAVLFVVLLFALFYVRMKKTGKWSAQCHFIKAKKKDTNKNLRDDKKQESNERCVIDNVLYAPLESSPTEKQSDYCLATEPNKNVKKVESQSAYSIAEDPTKKQTDTTISPYSFAGTDETVKPHPVYSVVSNSMEGQANFEVDPTYNLVKNPTVIRKIAEDQIGYSIITEKKIESEENQSAYSLDDDSSEKQKIILTEKQCAYSVAEDAKQPLYQEPLSAPPKSMNNNVHYDVLGPR